jgi:hypothetical protein
MSSWYNACILLLNTKSKHMRYSVFFALIASFIFIQTVKADPWDCMSKEDAETLVEFLNKNPFVMEYCDCCDNQTAHLVRIRKMKIVPCHWDESQYSVAVVRYTIAAMGYVEDGEFVQVMQEPDPEDLKLYGNAEYYTPTLNYSFSRQKGKAVHLNTQTGEDRSDDVGCEGLKAFPQPKKLKKIKGCWAYRRFYRRNR